jgi:hypothetical protein
LIWWKWIKLFSWQKFLILFLYWMFFFFCDAFGCNAKIVCLFEAISWVGPNGGLPCVRKQSFFGCLLSQQRLERACSNLKDCCETFQLFARSKLMRFGLKRHLFCAFLWYMTMVIGTQLMRMRKVVGENGQQLPLSVLIYLIFLVLCSAVFWKKIFVRIHEVFVAPTFHLPLFSGGSLEVESLLLCATFNWLCRSFWFVICDVHIEWCSTFEVGLPLMCQPSHLCKCTFGIDSAEQSISSQFRKWFWLLCHIVEASSRSFSFALMHVL